MIGHAESLLRVSNGRTELRRTSDTGRTVVERYSGRRAILGVALTEIRGQEDTASWVRGWLTEIRSAQQGAASTPHELENATAEQLDYAAGVLSSLQDWSARNGVR